MIATAKTPDYVWVLENKITGKIHPSYEYETRASARKAIWSKNGRFVDYTPVKLYKTKLTTSPTRQKKTGTFTTTTKTKKSSTRSIAGGRRIFGGTPIYAR